MNKQTHAARAAYIRERAKQANEHDARELYLYALNTSGVYFGVIDPTINSLRRHVKRGNYSKDAALVAWQHAANKAAKLYISDYGGAFGVADRCAAAVALCEAETECVFFGLNDQAAAPSFKQ